METLTIISFILVALSIMITLFSALYGKLKPLQYWRTILTLQSIAGLCGVMAVIVMSINGNNQCGFMYYVAIILCIITSFVMSFILTGNTTKKITKMC